VGNKSNKTSFIALQNVKNDLQKICRQIRGKSAANTPKSAAMFASSKILLVFFANCETSFRKIGQKNPCKRAKKNAFLPFAVIDSINCKDLFSHCECITVF
jgi:hypothetical protein